MHFSKSPKGSKSAITMRPVSLELTLMLSFLLIQNFLVKTLLTYFLSFFKNVKNT